ncbi:hypothetical protein [Wukongibacter baidiensis]
MSGADSLDKKYLFDEVVLNYEKRRPNYGVQLFKDIIKYAGINIDSSSYKTISKNKM